MPERSALPHVAFVGLAGLGWIVGLALLAWLADRAWPAFMGGATLVYAALLPASGVRSLCMVALALAWSLRLGIYITLRNRGHGEDRRYRQMRERNQPHFGFKSLYLVFGL